jgi:anti-sigma28 factor (negative regulator of flagellin synthesis)
MAIDSSDQFIYTDKVEEEAADYEASISFKEDEISEIENEISDMEDEDEEDIDHEKIAELKQDLEALRGELVGLQEEAEDIFKLLQICEDYARGNTLINDDYWPQYVQDMASDTTTADLSSWPCNCIDWDVAADQLLSDYTTVTWCGQDFHVQS